jgi:hypothetical protein
LTQWKRILQGADEMPATRGAAILWDAWEALEPVQRQHWRGAVGERQPSGKGEGSFALVGLNVGLNVLPQERRPSQNRTVRLVAFLDALSASAETGMKEIARPAQAREQMARRLTGRRSSSNLPAAVDLERVPF